MRFDARRRWKHSGPPALGLAVLFLLTGQDARSAEVAPLLPRVNGVIEQLKRDCRYDLETYCSTVTPGEGRLALCIMAHADKRSPACEIGLEQARREAEDMLSKAADACQGDIAKLCAGTEPGGGRIAQCLLDQQASLSQGCADVAHAVEMIVFPASSQPEVGVVETMAGPSGTEAPPASAEPKKPAAQEIIDALDAKVAAIIETGRQGCAKDLDTYCATVTPGEGRLAFCLIAHADKRSAECEGALLRARTEAENIINDIDRSIDACAPDIASHCSGTKPGDGRIAACLMGQRDSLSDNCGAIVDKLGKVIFPPANDGIADAPQTVPASEPVPAATAVAAVAKAPALQALEGKVQSIIEIGKAKCAADLERFCSTVTPGEGRLAMCLVAHADKRSPECETALADARAEAETLISEISRSIDACAPDIAALCAGTEPGEGRMAQCLADQRESLTEDCGAVLDRVGKIIFAPGNAAAAAAAPVLSPVEQPVAAPQDAAATTQEKQCQTVEATVTDLGQDGTSLEARKVLKLRARAFAAGRGLKDYTSGAGSVSCKPSATAVVPG